MQKIILLLALLTFNLSSSQIKKKQVLLIGTFHYANPGLDVAQLNSFSIMSEKSQKELEIMSDKIKKFGPDKIFVEWEFSKQTDLDKFYNKNTDSLFKNNKSEITQLALRTAKKLNHKKLYGMNLYTSFRYDSLMMAMEKANQKDLIQRNKVVRKISKSSITKKLEKVLYKK